MGNTQLSEQQSFRIERSVVFDLVFCFMAYQTTWDI